ncbi:hypothetical protein ALQ89_100939 [Pseudomonas amygdali pv. tabaci]|uniref:Uncharacterized protein n=2 Tax=Pseudomonas amygdali TaxID=47877 RepID=A0AAX1VN99_PSEAJ|nr:Unknown protein sequence [Pseudomonas amygdali pv. sesami]KPX73195.1 hypothetical protein ALO35_103055 [Pseudomonas amygdali pv. lachrymans]KPY77943.1 hypothetical protein ALO60_102422 [Pseudomonas amygdali pv. tabaci]KPY59020.1 hypothetical protein ALO93_102906 [Pseudomonas amygdali pv. sesami]RML75731.1 hypothetical protein ALQ89_100939 [Pseudomonas amygdali pv. tabaci]
MYAVLVLVLLQTALGLVCFQLTELLRLLQSGSHQPFLLQQPLVVV